MAQVDEHAVRELVLYAENDGTLYRQKTVPIRKNLARKILRGTYSSAQAVKAWRHLADAAAKQYTREFDTPGTPGYGIFTVADRNAAAVEFRDDFEASVEAGDYDLKELAKG